MFKKLQNKSVLNTQQLNLTARLITIQKKALTAVKAPANANNSSNSNHTQPINQEIFSYNIKTNLIKACIRNV